MAKEIPYLDLQGLHAPLMGELERAFKEVMSDSTFSSGPHVETFEKDFAKFIGTSNAIGVSSGTSALHLSLVACDIGLGDEVIAPAMTFMATVSAIKYSGATPVLVDVEKETYCIDPSLIKAAITERTKAIIVVHLYGQACDIKTIRKIADQHNLIIIEDAAQAHGASLGEKRCGTIGDLAAFSFYPGKNLGACGEAGAVVTNDQLKADKIRAMRDWGQVNKGNHVYEGFNYRMDGLQGAFLGVKLKHLDQWTQTRILRAKLYKSLLGSLEEIKLPKSRENSVHVFHIFAVLISDRDKILMKMKAQGIYCGIHYPTPIHLHKNMQDLGYMIGEFPIAERIAKEEISLPLYPNLSESDLEYISQSLKDFIISN
jgi:dTDP-4-amino-4,6-dideoxygalactose transaminase